MREGDAVTVVLQGTVLEDDGATVNVLMQGHYADCSGEYFAADVTTRNNVVCLSDVEARTVAALVMAQRDTILRTAGTSFGEALSRPSSGGGPPATSLMLVALANLTRILQALGLEQ